ncbi:MAG: hypothetical protein HY860_06300 [Chlamydiales bacterium]|nr:hypothetical protein [Chlamydiales bacterium]
MADTNEEFLHDMHFENSIPIHYQAETLTQAIVDKVKYILKKMSHNQVVSPQDLYDLESFAQVLKNLMIANPKDFSNVQQEYISSIARSALTLADHPNTTSSKSLILVEASAQTLLYQLQNHKF